MGPFQNLMFGQNPKQRTPMQKSLYEVPKSPFEDEEYPYRPPQTLEQQPTEPVRSLQNNMQSYYQPGPAATAYTDYLGRAPKEEDYKPTKITRLGAILSGMSAGWQNPSAGPEVANRILRRPYEQAIDDYEREGNRLKTSAGLEDNTYDRNIRAANNQREIENDTFTRANTIADNKRADEQLAITKENSGTVYDTDMNGIKYKIDRYGTKTPLGKFDESLAEKEDRAVKASDRITARQEASQNRVTDRQIAAAEASEKRREARAPREPKEVSYSDKSKAKNDATNEVLNSTEFSWLRTDGHVKVDDKGNLIPTYGGESDSSGKVTGGYGIDPAKKTELNNHIARFKKRVEEETNKLLGISSGLPSGFSVRDK